MINFNWLFLVEEHCNSRLFVLLYDEAFFLKITSLNRIHLIIKSK